MENQNSYTNLESSSEKLTLSYELLQLMEWLVDHEADALKKIIIRAFRNGFYDSIIKTQKTNSPEIMQNNIVDFLSLLEMLLYETANEQAASNVIQKNKIPMVDHVDTLTIDPSSLRSTAAVVASKIERNPKTDAKEILFKELLKRWKPSTKKSLEN